MQANPRKTAEDLLDLIPRPWNSHEVLKTVMQKCYETDPRYVVVGDGTTKFGLVFPMQVEILHDVMVMCRDKVVLELAAAGGENSLLIGLAGAKEVYVNDIAAPELTTFKGYLNELPKEAAEKFHVVAGDCFEVFRDDKYTGMFDVIYARNFYHFFLGDKKIALHKLLTRLLKPGGKLILTTNSSNSTDLNSKSTLAADHPDCYIFQNDTPMVRSSLQKGNDRICSTSNKALSAAEGEQKDPLHYEFYPVLKFINERQIGVTNRMSQLNQNVQTEIRKFADMLLLTGGIYFKESGQRKMSLSKDYLEVHSCVVVTYSQRTLPKQFVGTGLIAIKVWSTDVQGHLTDKNREEVSVSVMCVKK